MDSVFYLFVVSETIEPGNVRLSTKPRHLALGVMAGIALNNTNRIVPVVTRIESLKDVTIADRAEGLCVGGKTSGDQLPNFFNPPPFKHAMNPFFDPPIGLCPGRVEADRVDFE